VLTEEERKTLIKRYELWGVENVREQLRHPDHDMLVAPEVIELARAWIRRKETQSQRLERRLAVLGGSTVGLALGIVMVGLIP
jgi:hypothetical protein